MAETQAYLIHPRQAGATKAYLFVDWTKVGYQTVARKLGSVRPSGFLYKISRTAMLDRTRDFLKDPEFQHVVLDSSQNLSLRRAHSQSRMIVPFFIFYLYFKTVFLR